MKTIRSLATMLLFCSPLHADFSNNQPASSVIGKPDFTTTTPTTASANNLLYPTDIAIDPTTGKVFVSDGVHHRILRFSSTAAYESGGSAEVVLGQATFVGDAANQGGSVGASTLSNPSGLTIDAAGRLWVADFANNRVLRYDGVSAKTSGAAADGVFGQATFTTAATATSVAGLAGPADVCIDSAGNLWVADFLNHRVLRYEAAAGRANGAAANQVLGQVNFTSAVAALNAAGMAQPFGLAVDQALGLWVTCQSQNRILRFDNAPGKGDGGSANAVLGQANFDSGGNSPITAASLSAPQGCVVSPDGTLWVGDSGNHRVLGYQGAAGKASGASADLVLGQPSFATEDVFGATAQTIQGPYGVAIGRDGVLFVSNTVLRRVLRFSPAVEITAPSRIKARNGRAKIRGSSKFASLVNYKAPKRPTQSAVGPAANWTVNLKGLTRPTTRIAVTASAFDGRSAQTVVVVKSRR
jgi:sugar lactone lactonase YvrE